MQMEVAVPKFRLSGVALVCLNRDFRNRRSSLKISIRVISRISQALSSCLETGV